MRQGWEVQLCTGAWREAQTRGNSVYSTAAPEAWNGEAPCPPRPPCLWYMACKPKGPCSRRYFGLGSDDGMD